MVDLITAIGDDAGFKVSVQATPFSALIPSLTSVAHAVQQLAVRGGDQLQIGRIRNVNTREPGA